MIEPVVSQTLTAKTVIDSPITKLLLALPILIGLILKLAGITLIPRMMMKALEDFLDASRGAPLDDDQRRLIIDVVSNEAIKTTTVLTFIIAEFDAFVALYLQPSFPHLIVLSLLVFIFIGFLFWILPLYPLELSERSFFGLKRCDLVTLSFCLIDVILGALTLST